MRGRMVTGKTPPYIVGAWVELQLPGLQLHFFNWHKRLPMAMLSRVSGWRRRKRRRADAAIRRSYLVGGRGSLLLSCGVRRSSSRSSGNFG